MGTLYVIGTPIGNLEDVTLRALRILKEVDVILCEDTRVTKRLLDRHGVVHKPQAAEQSSLRGKQLVTYNERQSGITAGKIIGWLEAGKNVALVSDAGTPGISDPGAYLVEKIRTYVKSSTSDVEEERCGVIKIEAVPGPSALTAALSVAGVPASEFLFLGFLPHKKGRETLFKEITASERAVVFYESPHRILKALEALSTPRGFVSSNEAKPRQREKWVTVCRELTKIHEEVKSGSAAELLEFFKNNQEKVRGEFVVIVAS